MKGDKECEEYHCSALSYCTWRPDECIGARLSIKADSLNVREAQEMIGRIADMIQEVKL